MDLRRHALELLCLADPVDKAASVRALFEARPALALDAAAAIDEPAGLPGRPQRPRLVPHVALARRSPFTPEGRAALLHAVAHIEFNAINKAADANALRCAAAGERLGMAGDVVEVGGRAFRVRPEASGPERLLRRAPAAGLAW